MKPSGWIFITVSWVAIISLMVFSYARVLRRKK